MAKEIERKFLLSKVPEEAYRHPYIKIVQGYLSDNPVVRVRLSETELDKKGYLTIKGPKNGLSADEFEYEIPFEEASAMMLLAKNPLSKIRYVIPFNKLKIELDVFEDIKGLVVAEIELPSEKHKITLPKFITEVFLKEVTEDHDFSNASLAKNGLAKEKYNYESKLRNLL